MVKTAEKKVYKYTTRIDILLSKVLVTRKDLEKIHGYLNYAAVIEPFGRPFLSTLTNAIQGKPYNLEFPLPSTARRSLHLWKEILRRNLGSSLKFILNDLARAKNNIFIDASTSWGIGGCCGPNYFCIPWSELSTFNTDVIARKELLACLVAVFCFGDIIANQLVSLYTDNQNVVVWLRKGRSTSSLGNSFLAAWELGKYRARCKISPAWLPSTHNRTADALSRNTIPDWLARGGRKLNPDLGMIASYVVHPIRAWSSIL